MGESVRKRKSLWDSIEETQQPAPVTEKKDNFSNIHMDHMDNNSDKNKDSKWVSGERMQGSVNKNDEMRNLDRNSHSRRILEGENSDGWGGVSNSKHSPENYRIQANRYKRSRSRSRSHSRERGRGRSRSRSRGRYRNRDNRSRSRSPLPERRPEPHGWTDGRSGGTGIASQPCRDFSSTGKCWRGSQCRFLHDDNSIGQQGGIRIEKDRSERWNRQDSGNNHCHGEKDVPFRNSGNSASLCLPFLKGRCQRGSSCWFLHHDASGETTMGRSHRSSYNNNDQDDREKPSRSSKPPCKYFMMGNCHKDNCSFSHDGPHHDSFEKKPHDDRWPRPESDGSKWGDIGAVSDTKVSTVWDASVREGSFNNDTIVGNFAQGSWDNFLKTDESNWGGPSDVLGLTGAGNLLVTTEKSDKAANGNESVSFSNGISRLAHIDDKKPERDLNMAIVDYENSVNALGSYSSVGPRLPLQQVSSPLSLNFPQVKSDTEKVVKSEQNEQGGNFLPSITHILHPEQLPQLYAALNPPNSIAPMPSFPLSNGPPHIPSMDAQPIPVLLQRHYSEMSDIIGTMKTMESDQKDGAAILSELSQVKQNASAENQNRSQIAIANTLTEERNQSVVPANKGGQDKTGRENVNVEGKGKDAASNEKDEKALKLFKVSLVELVKEILKPKWKEGQMSRDVHKTIVKKVVDKVTASLQGDNIPNTPQKIEQYLSYSKTKISKLAEAYFERLKKSS